MADDKAKITIDSEINTEGVEKGIENIDKKLKANAANTQKEFEKVEDAVKEFGEAAEEAAEAAARAVKEAAAKQIEAIKSQEREKLYEVKDGEAAQIDEIVKAANEKKSLLKKEKSQLDESVYNERLAAIRKDERAKTNEIKRGTEERNALIKKDSQRQINTVKDSERKQLEEIKKSNQAKTQSLKEFGDEANQALSKASSFISTGGLSALGLGAVAAGVKQAVSALNEWGQEALQQEMATSRLNAVLKSTGAEAWASSTLLQRMADEQRAATGKSREELSEMQAVLLGFRSVTRDVFEDATQAILDMAAVMGGGLVSTANILGKALDSPLEGMGALSRQGFVFTAQQRELIKALEETGRHEEAQRVILKEVQAAFEGASVATSSSVQAQIRYNNALEDFKKNIGIRWNKLLQEPKEASAAFLESLNQSLEKQITYSDALEYLGNISQEAVLKINAEKKAIEELKTEMENASIFEMELYQKQIEAHEEAIRLEEERDEQRRWNSEQNIIILQHELDFISKRWEDLSFFEMAELNAIQRRLEANGQTLEQRREELELNIKSIKVQMDFDAEKKAAAETAAMAAAEAAKAEDEELETQITIAGKREANRKALEQEIALIIKKANLEGKNIKSEEIQKQILNARVSAYMALVKEIGDAGEEEKRIFNELREEYARMEIDAAARLQEDNLKNLERQKQAVLEKAELEGKAAGSLEVQKELLDAEVQAYGKQLEILRELIDGTGEEESERRRALQASWDQYRAEQITAEAQKKRLEDLTEAQKKFIDSASSLYASTVKEAQDSANRRESGQLLEAEKKAMEDYQKWALPFWTETQRQREEAAVTAINATAEHEKKVAREAAVGRIKDIKKEREELQQSEEKQAEWIANRMREVQAEYERTLAEIEREKAPVSDYTVQAGDELGKIAQMYGTTVNEILELNKKLNNEIINPDLIRPGDKIMIPGQGTTPEETNEARLNAEKDYNAQKELLNSDTNEAIIQADLELAEAEKIVLTELAEEEARIKKESDEKIKNMDKERLKILAKNVSEYLDTFKQAADSIFSIWNSVIDAELEEELRKNDEIVQSDEDRVRREKELRREAAMEKYKADLAQYAVNIIMANGKAALAILTAMAEIGPAGAVIAGVLGALNVAAVIAAKPQPPRFHQGGMVQGTPGKEVTSILKTGEAVLTPSQFQDTMSAIARLAHGDGGGNGMSLNVDVKNYTSHARVEKPVLDRGVLHMIIRDEINGMYGSGELDTGIARKEYRDRGIILE